MKALITGASSGIGKDMALYLSELGYDLILVAKTKEKLEKVKEQIKTKAIIIVADLSKREEVEKLYYQTKKEKIDLLINNAGFGAFGTFDQIDLAKELEMIEVNIKALHILMKLFLRDMEKRDQGIILNVASSAAFYPGPLMATYYATKAYVYRLSLALQEELKKKKSKVQVSVLCPGPVDTNFNQEAGVRFRIKSLPSRLVARYAIDKTIKGKKVIIPGIIMKLGKFFSRFIPDFILAKVAYYFQKKKEGK